MASKLEIEVDVRKGDVAQGIFQGIGQSIAHAGLALASAGIDAAIDAIGSSISLASDKAEAGSKVNVLYGDSADRIHEASENAARTVGMSSGAYLDAAGTLGNLLTNFGIAQGAAAGMSTEMLQLAADVGSFNNADPTEVVEAMGAAFRGESEPIRRFGVMLDVAKVKAKAMELGLYDGVGALTDSAKATATYQLILEQTSAAQGDFARTADGLANSQRIAQARIDDALTSLGEKLMPIVQELVPMLADGLVGAIDAVSSVLDFLGPAIDAVVGAFRFLIDVLGGTVNLFHDLHRAIDPAMAAMEDVQTEFVEVGRAAGLTEEQISRAWADTTAAARNGSLDQSASIEDVVASFVESEAAAAQMARGVELNAERAVDSASRIAASADDMAESFVASVDRIPAAVAIAADQANMAEALRDRAVDTMPEAARSIAASVRVQLSSERVRGEALAAARAIGEAVPGEIADGLVEQSRAVLDAADRLVDLLVNGLSPEEQALKLIGGKYTKAVARGIESEIPGAREAALQVAVEAIDTIENAGLEGAKGVRGMEAIGKYYDALLAGGMTAAEARVALAAGGVADATSASLEGKASAFENAGERVGGSWITGFASRVKGGQHIIDRAVAIATRATHGMSPPRHGPLRHIDDWGANVFRAWIDGGASALRRGGAKIDGALAQVMGGGVMGGGVRLAAAGAPAGGGGVTINVYAGVGDPVEIGRQVSEALRAYQRASGSEA